MQLEQATKEVNILRTQLTTRGLDEHESLVDELTELKEKNRELTDNIAVAEGPSVQNSR